MASRSKEYVLSTKMTVNDAQFKQKMGGAGKTLKSFGKAAAVGFAVAGVAAVALGTKAVMAASRFETGMAEVSTLSDAAFEQVEALSQGVLELTGRLGTDAIEATGALYQAISAGIPAGNAIDFLTIATKAAIGGVTDTETAVDGLTTVMNGFKEQNINAQQAADVMFQTVKLGKTDFEQLSRSLFQVIPLAAASGVSFHEVAASLATLTAQGVPTSVAATQVNAAIQGLIKPSKALTTIFNAAGHASGEAAVKQLGFAQAAEIVREATGGSTAEMTKLLGSIDGVKAILAITGPNAEVFAGNLDSIENSAGAATAAFEIMDNTTEATFNKIKSTINNTMIEIGGAVLNYLRPVIDTIQEQLPLAIESARVWFDIHGPAIENAITKVATVFLWVKDQIFFGINVILKALQFWWGWISKHKPLIIAVFLALGTAIVFALGPISLATLAITALVVLIGWMSENWRTVVIAILSFIENLIRGFRDMIQSALAMPVPWEKIWAAILSAVSFVARGYLEYLRSIVTGARWLIEQALKLPLPWSKIWNAIIKAVAGAADSILAKVQDMLRGVRNMVSGLANLPGMSGIFGGVVSSIDSAINKVGDLRKAVKNNLQYTGSDVDLKDSVLGVFDTAIDKISLWQQAIDKAIKFDGSKEMFSDSILSGFDDVLDAISGYKEKLVAEVAAIDVSKELERNVTVPDFMIGEEFMRGSDAITSDGPSGLPEDLADAVAAGAAGSGKAGQRI